MRFVLVLVLCAHPAWSEPTEVGVAVNPPLVWPHWIGGSLYTRIARDQVLRANVASYEYQANTIGQLASLAAGDDGDEGDYQGRITDVGLGWMYFSRRAYDGFSVEAGAFERHRNVSVSDEFAPVYRVATRSNMLAGRALIGWSWLFYDHVFLSIAAGMSMGYEWGTQTDQPSELDAMQTASRFGRIQFAGEAFSRLGVVFGI